MDSMCADERQQRLQAAPSLPLAMQQNQELLF